MARRARRCDHAMRTLKVVGPGRYVLVQDVPVSADEEQLLALFSAHGTVEECPTPLLRSRVRALTHEADGYGFARADAGPSAKRNWPSASDSPRRSSSSLPVWWTPGGGRCSLALNESHH